MERENRTLKIDDATLLERYAGHRSADAFTELVRRYAGMVHGTCLRILGNARDAEDVAQECFMELATQAGTGIRSVPGWLHTVAMNRSLGAIRSSARRRKREEEAVLNEQTRVSEPTWEAIAPDVDRALAELPDDLRLPLILHYLQGKGQQEIAEAMAISQSTVSRRIETGVDELRQRLRKAGVAVSSIVLASLLAANGATAAPVTLLAALGKMAMAGVGSTGGTIPVTPAAEPAATGMSWAVGKATIAVVTIALAWVLVTVYRQAGRSGSVPALSPVEPTMATRTDPATGLDNAWQQNQPERDEAEMKKLMIGAGIVTMSITGTMAQSDATIGAATRQTPSPAPEAIALKDMVFEGVVRMMSAGPVLVTDDGTRVRLPMSIPSGTGEIALRDYDGARVRVVGMGVEGSPLGAKTGMALKSIKTIARITP